MKNITAENYTIENITFLESGASAFEAYEKMTKEQIHHIPIIENGKAIGIISDRDLQYLYSNANAQEIKCTDVMTKSPIVVSTTAEITSVAKTMIDKKVNSILINNDAGKVVGIFTSTDALKLLAESND